MCFTTLGGGMEHQTMTTIGVTDTRTIAHELAHQWWGNNVTYSRWGDVWLSEGFATFSEQLYYDRFWGAAKAKSLRQTYLSNATTTAQACGQVFVTDTSGPVTLFNQATVYKKGQAVVTMLRYIAPSDTVFFQMLRDYQRTYAQGNAGTADLKAIAEAHYGFELDNFFNKWIYGKGYPRYTITWNQVGTSLFVKMIQEASCPATTPHFSTPLQLQLKNTTADTTMKVYNSLDTQIYSFDWAPAVTSVVLNPDVWTICALKTSIKRDTTLGLSTLTPGNKKVYPNPTQNHWQIEDLQDNTLLTLTDMSGRTLWQGKSTRHLTTIPGDKLPAGYYLLLLSGADGDEQIKLTHW
jgi:aminopeptidase N